MKLLARPALAAVAAAALFATHSVSAQTVSIGALPTGSLSYGIASGVAKVIADKASLNTRAVGVGGSNIFIPQVAQGKLDMSTANSIEATFAKKGTGTFDGHANPNLMAIARLLEFQTGFMVRKDSDIQKITDFKGKPFPSGFTSQKIIGIQVGAIFKAEGMNWDDIEPVPVPNFVRGTDEFVAGKAVGSYLAPGSAIVRKANAAVGIRFLSLEASPEKEKILQEMAPGTYFTTVKPSKQLPYIEKPTTMLGFDYLLLGGKHVSEEVAYKSAKALYENKAALIEAHGVFRGFDPKLMAKPGVGVDYHPGAVKFYKEVGVL